MNLSLLEAFPDVTLDDYRAKVSQFRNMAEAAGFRIPPASTEDWLQLEKLSPEHRQVIFNYFSIYLSVCQEVLATGTPITNDRQLLWRMLGKLKLRPAPELFGEITEGDVIEIYDTNLFQLFRNLAFFSVSSYSFEQLMHYPLIELFSRPTECTAVLTDEIKAIFSGVSGTILRSKVGEHTARELISKQQFEARVEQKIISPLYNTQGQIAGLVATLRILSLRPTVGLKTDRRPQPLRAPPSLSLA